MFNMHAIFLINSWDSYQDMRLQEQANALLLAADTT